MQQTHVDIKIPTSECEGIFLNGNFCENYFHLKRGTEKAGKLKAFEKFLM